MPTYYFDICEGQSLPDKQGLELKSLVEAKAHAITIAMTYLHQPSVEFWRDHAWSVGIREQGRGLLFQLDVSVTQMEEPI